MLKASGMFFTLLLSLSLVSAQGESMQTKRTARDAAEQAHTVLWSKFVDKHGIIIDFVGEIPTPEECALSKPNAMGWFCPIENGPMFNGLYLPAAIERARRSNNAVDKENARRLVQGLLKCASVSDVPGMIVRGMATDGKSHYPLGSDDQTHPWFLGLYTYWKSNIPSAAEKREIVNKVKEVACVLNSNGWNCPCDGSFKGQSRGGFAGELFRDAVRYLFMLRAIYEMTGDDVWLERYKKALTECPGKSKLTRLEICAIGYKPDIAHFKWTSDWGPHWNWIYVGAQDSLRNLIKMETDPAIKAQYQAGLTANVKEALAGLGDFEKFDNNDTNVFGSANWREVYSKWSPQKTQAEALKVSELGDKTKAGERFNYEHRYMTAQIAGAAIVALAGDPAHHDTVEKIIRHYDYSKLYMSRLFFAECAYYAYPENPKQK
jgi:hypothetical protein